MFRTCHLLILLYPLKTRKKEKNGDFWAKIFNQNIKTSRKCFLWVQESLGQLNNLYGYADMQARFSAVLKVSKVAI